MDTRYFNDGIKMSPHVAAKDEVCLVVDPKLSWAVHFQSETAAREGYSGTVFQMWTTQLFGVQFLILSPIQVAEEAPETKKKVLCGAIGWCLAQLPQGEAGITRAEHDKIHAIQKLWGG